MRVRMQFEKKGDVKFIGHLDLMRLFQRAINRAGIPIAYSQGFNPHQIVCFASPLPLGIESEREYIDISLMSNDENEKNTAEKLNKTMPEGIKVRDAVKLPEYVKTAAADVCAAKYEAVIEKEIPDTLIQNFLDEPSFFIEKRTKKNIKETDIRPDIFAVRKTGERQIELFLSCGSTRNIKAELAVHALYYYGGISNNPFQNEYKRIDLYRERNKQYESLIEV